MTILLPVINNRVDEILLDFLSKNKYGDQLVPKSDFGADQNHNKNNNKDDNNNNKKSSQDEFEEDVLNWADEPWNPCEDVEVPDWAKMEDPTTDDFNCDLVWAEDPWTQEPLVDIPSWMMLPGIDYSVEVTDPVVDTPVENGEDDPAFLASGIEVKNWCDEPYDQLPLDVPRWALLPGIDFPVHRGNNSPYWKSVVENNFIVRRQFRRNINKSKFWPIEEGNRVALAIQTIRAHEIAKRNLKKSQKTVKRLQTQHSI